MQRYISCIVHNSSEGNLLIGDNFTAMFDCGMMFCADKTIRRVEKALNGRILDYIFCTHTHYDHIGAIPYFRNKWQNVKVVTCEAGAAVLLKDTPRRVIRKLSEVAAKEQGIEHILNYNDDVFQADMIIKEGVQINLGGITVQVIETPGHTRDSLSFYVPELELLILSETTGVLLTDGTVYTCYLTGYNDSINAVEKCRNLNYKSLSLPHRGIVSKKDANSFFDKAIIAFAECRDFILMMKEKQISEDEMTDELFRKYGTETLLTFQPKDAFYANAKAIIACTLREYQN